MKIHTLDLLFLDTPRAIAAFLLETAQGLHLIECGPQSTLPILLNGIRELGFDPAQIRHVLVTHIHLDHAGAAGWWAQQGAQIYVHPLGAPHLAEPSKLLASAGRIYGEHMSRLWGTMLPVPAHKLTTPQAGEILQLAGVNLQVVDSPGHARHHYAYLVDGVLFCGDAAGERTLGETFLTMPTPPPEFDLESWQVTTDQLRNLRPDGLYLTHFGLTSTAQLHFEEQTSLLQRCTAFVGELVRAGKSRDEIVSAYVEWNLARASERKLAQRGLMDYGTIFPYAMSTDGLIRYWRKKLELSQS